MDNTNLDEFIEGDIKNFSKNISEKISSVKENISNDIISEYNTTIEYHCVIIIY